MGMQKRIPFGNLNKIINPCFDPVFKSIFTKDTPESKQALRGLVSAIIQKDLRVVDVTTNEPPVNASGDKQIRYDINCILDDGQKANVEMTLWPKAYEVYKMEYYLARLHTSQETKGAGKNEYFKLKQSYQISLFAKGNVFRDKEFFHKFVYYDAERRTDLGGRTAICTVELKKLWEVVQKPVEEMTRLEKWAFFFAYFSDPCKQDILRQILESEEEISMAESMMARISPAEVEALRQMSEDKYRMDRASLKYDIKRKKRRFKRIKAKVMKQGLERGLERGLEQGLEQGLERGLERGLQQGYEQAKREYEEKLVKANMEKQQEMALKMEALGLSAEQIQAIISSSS